MKNRVVLFSATTCVALICFLVPAAQAQYRASIQGVITDPKGAVVPEATVILVDRETGRTMTSTTNGAGVYNFNALPPSRYTLSVEKAASRKKSWKMSQSSPNRRTRSI